MPHSAQERDIEQEIKALFTAYLAAWNARDFDAVAKCYTEPSLFVLPDATVPIADHAAMIALLERIFAGLEADGFSHTEIDKISIQPRGDTLATADAYTVRRLRGDGTEVEVIDAHYVLRRGKTGWQFTTAVSLPHKWTEAKT